MKIVYLESGFYTSKIRQDIFKFLNSESIKVKEKNYSQIILENGINISFKFINVERASDILRKINKEEILFFTHYRNKEKIKEIEKRINKKINIKYIDTVKDIYQSLLKHREPKIYYKVNKRNFKIEKVELKEHKELEENYFRNKYKAKNFAIKNLSISITLIKPLIRQAESHINILIKTDKSYKGFLYFLLEKPYEMYARKRNEEVLNKRKQDLNKYQQELIMLKENLIEAKNL